MTFTSWLRSLRASLLPQSRHGGRGRRKIPSHPPLHLKVLVRGLTFQGDDVNQEGRTIPASLPRIDFFHWVLVDLPPSDVGVAAGEFSSSVVPRGKPGPQAQRAHWR